MMLTIPGFAPAANRLSAKGGKEAVNGAKDGAIIKKAGDAGLGGIQRSLFSQGADPKGPTPQNSGADP